MLLALLLPLLFEAPSEWKYVGATLASVLAFALTVRSIGRFREWMRLRRELRVYQYRLCDSCWYPLPGLDRNGKCPECGRPYDVDALRNTWVDRGY